MVEESCFSLSLTHFLSHVSLSLSLLLSTFIPSLCLLSSSPLITSSSSREELLLLLQTLCGALGFRQPQSAADAGSQESRQPGSQAALPVSKMSNSLIVIMRLCHLPIIGMIKDEIFREAGLLT